MLVLYYLTLILNAVFAIKLLAIMNNYTINPSVNICLNIQ